MEAKGTAVAERTNSVTPFWSTTGGHIIRWIAFLPAAIILPLLVLFLFALFVEWLNSLSTKGIVILEFFIGGGTGFLALIITCMGVYISVLWSLQTVCPTPRVGSCIYGTIWGPNAALWLVRLFTNWPGFILLVCGVIVNVIIFSAIRTTYKEAKVA